MKLFVLLLLAIFIFFVVLYFYRTQPLMEGHGGGGGHGGHGHGGYIRGGYGHGYGDCPYLTNYFYVPTPVEQLYWNA